ncbi:hypothetical protein ACFPRL_15570 [Pseudoclavibacter helvolus]
MEGGANSRHPPFASGHDSAPRPRPRPGERGGPQTACRPLPSSSASRASPSAAA